MANLIGRVAASVVAVAPWFLLSIGLGVSARALRPAEGLVGVLERRPGQALVIAALVGAFTPFCSCTVVPVVAGLLLAGMPLAPVMTFWVASPTMDPEIFSLTVAILGWPLAVTRLAATLALSLGAGLGVHLLSRRLGDPLRRSPDPAPQPMPAGSGGTVLLRERVRALDRRVLLGQVLSETWYLGRWLVAAFALEALIVAYVPQGGIASTLGAANPFSVPLAALVGVPLYLGNLTALPIVSGLLERGMAPGAAIAFLLAGPVTTVPAMVAVRSLVRTPVFAYYLGVGLVGAALLGWAAGVVLGG